MLLRTDQKQLLHTKSQDERGCCGKCFFRWVKCLIRAVNCIGIGRKSDMMMLKVEEKMAVAADPARVDVPPPITLEEREEDGPTLEGERPSELRGLKGAELS